MTITKQELYMKKDSERVPLMVQATASLRSESAKYGFTHVQSNLNGKFYCYYKGMNTGLHPTPMLAANALLRMAKKNKIEVTNHIEVEYYPEYFANTPAHIDEDAISYMRDPSVKAGWKGIKVRKTKDSGNVFVCNIVLDGQTHKSKGYPTPIEAVWAVHTGRAAVYATYKQQPDVPPPADLSIIKYLMEGSGFKYVQKSGEGFKGRFSIKGIYYSTKMYLQIQDAAWAVHHHIQDAKMQGFTLDSFDNIVRAESGASIRKRLYGEYSGIKSILPRMLRG